MRWVHKGLLSLAALLTACVGSLAFPGQGVAAQDVCSAGTGLPPFLGSGADPNLLLMLDNSGSMLDMAYVDDETYTLPPTADIGDLDPTYKKTCSDNKYLKEQKDGVWSINPAKEYAGYFEKDIWYKWEEPGLTLEGINPVDIAQWDSAKAYKAGDLVAYQGMVFKANTLTDAGQKTLLDNRNGAELAWDRLDEGYFSPQTSAPCATPSYTYTVADGAGGNRLELQVSFDNAATPTAVTCFAARGNLLNWATASKLDIQKKILTGGKFYAGNEVWNDDGVPDNTVQSDIDDDRLVSEHRGCSGKGFAKVVPLDGTDKPLVLKVRGPVEQTDKLDAADFTTRIEIVGLGDTEQGINYESCATYIKLLESGAQHNDLRAPLKSCLYGTKEIQPVFNIYHSALHDCWKIAKGDAPPHAGNLQSQCKAVYTGAKVGDDLYPQQNPWMITPWDAHYICYGLWDEGTPPSPDNNYAGTGYVGRCWMDWPGEGGEVCKAKTCNVNDGTWTDKGDNGYFNNTDGVGQRCAGGLQYACDNSGSVDLSKKDPKCSTGGNFAAVFVKSDNKTLCVPTTTVANPEWGPVGEDKDCVEQAERDYCSSLNVPDVIDPTDLPTNTDGVVWGVGAAIIDAGIYGQMGVQKPLKVMKGYIKYGLPPEQLADKSERPDGPRGILYDVANNLRIGAMTFRDNGSKTECDKFKTTCTRNDSGEFEVCSGTEPDAEKCTYCTARQSIGKYCEVENNADGAAVIAQVEQGMWVDDMGTPGDAADDQEHWEHYVDLVAAINDIRATSWTPLAEAMYTALSYYGQNKVPRLDAGIPPFKLPDEGTTDDPWPDPVQYWCQDNHVLLITEGASTADINPTVVTFAKSHGESGETGENVCNDGLDASPYLDNLTYFGQNATVEGTAANSSNLYTQLIATNKEPPEAAYAKQPVTTHIVTSGSLRTDGTGECSPQTLMTNAATNGGSTLLAGENPDQLEANLKAVLSDILGRASAGSAASVISSSRSGEGAVYQAVFWPKVDRALGKDPLTWIGDVHGLFIDDQGRMWDDNSWGDEDGKGTLWSEDANGNGRLDAGEGTGCLKGDRRVFFYSDGKETKICFNDSAWTSDPPVCDTSLTNYCDKAGEPFPIKSFNKYLWSANQVLQGIDTAHLASNRKTNPTDDRWIWGTSPERYIFTWNDLDNDGIVHEDEVIPLVSSVLERTWADNDKDEVEDSDEISFVESPVDWAEKTSSHLIFHDFNVADNTEMNILVDWLRGIDSWYEVDMDKDGVLDPEEDSNGNGKRDDFRCRRADCDAPSNSTNPEWRLGDVVHSTPKLVAQPAEAFHTIYRDPSYAWFVKRHRYRRNVVYFGANDGMLHAVNGGFYNEKENKFYKNLTLAKGVASFDDSDPAPALGMELWAYVPYNLQPHLRCLAKPLYGAGDGTGHKYFVDKEPRIFDMQIFEEEEACSTDPYAQDCIHPKGWGTVLVGSMRFGGAPITAKDGPQWSASDTRQFISSYFLLDITDPERPPKLLGEMTRTIEKDPTDATRDKYANLGFSTPMPAAVVMRGGGGATTWYLVFGNGPNNIEGTNDQQGKVAVLPLKLDSTTGVLAKGARILNKPLSATDSGVIPVVDGATSATALVDDATSATKRFVSDMMTVDFDLEAQTDPDFGALYKSDAVYFGTVDGSGFAGDKWAGGGGVYRLVTRKLDGSGVQQPTTPSDWQIKKLIDTQAPVTGALSVGWDEANYWLYFGTGRFYATDDKKDDTVQRFFGVKEPLDTSCEMTWKEITWSGTSLNPAAPAGSRGLVRTDNIQVVESKSFMVEDQPVVFCPSDSATDIGATNYCNLGFLDTPLKVIDGIGYYSYEKLRQYIAGESRTSASSCPQNDKGVGVDGWYRVLQEPRERVTGQSALLGGLVTFTTYQPYADVCTAEGMSNLYGVHYQTGTAWYENVFGLSTRDGRTIVLDKLSLGVGLATTPSMHSGGEGSDAKAFIQSSTGEIIEIKQENLPIKPPKSGKMHWCDDCD